MAKRNGIDTTKLQPTVDVNTRRIVEEMIQLGIYGSNSSEVTSWIIRTWIWENHKSLRENGIDISRIK
ncbi:hypothetical protein [Sulfuriflexus mobilis]|uniref:hypothetical protein n=1 Tax=Sulfuriflexus mobilis TaxID=1811807 RepID=UPI000F83AA97|nr:hypothetical protein [Sulfuriflexus mobilis]